MTWRKKAVSAIICLLILWCSSAVSESFLPEMELENLSGKSIAVELGIKLNSHMPFDENRTGELQKLLDHVKLGMTIRQYGDNSWSQGSIIVDGSNALSYSSEKSGKLQNVSFSFDENAIYSGHMEQNLLPYLLNNQEESSQSPIYDALMKGYGEDLSAAIVAFAENCGVKPRSASIDETIRYMGRAKKKQVYTIPSSDAEGISENLAQYVENPEIKEWILSLTFSGKQTLTFFRNADGNVIQISYAGKCGKASGSLRTVNLKWRLRRDSKIRDNISLTSPAVSGTDKNTLTLTRDLLEEDGVPVLTCEWSHKWTAEKKTTTDTGNISLTSARTSSGTQIDGKIITTTLKPGETVTYKTEISPSLLFSTDEFGVYANGTVGYRYLSGKNLMEDAEISVSPAIPGMPEYDTLVEDISVDAMGEEELAQLRKSNLEKTASAIVRELVKIPNEDTVFLSKDIADESWNRIVEAANGQK